MDIADKEVALFNDWKSNRKSFVFDGVVSEKDYLESELKLCFVLKEVNDEGGGDWDLREFIRDGARWQTWDNVTRWVHCIRQLRLNTSWADLSKITKSDRRNTLRSICAMNLKKSPGTHTTDRANFNMVITEDQAYIKQQYSIYNPDITVCCGTGWDLRWALELNDTEVFETNRGIKWFKDENDNPVFIYAHPAARVQDSLIVYGLIDAIREVVTQS